MHGISKTRRFTIPAFAAVALMLVPVLLAACGGPTTENAAATTVPATSPAAASGTAQSVAGATSVLSGAAPDEKKNASIKIAAASDLRTVMTQIQPDIERQCETKVTFVFGSSGQLTTQIAAGADFALLLSADAQYPADLVRAGAVVPNGTASYAIGRIVLATRAGLEPLSDLKAVAQRPDIQTFAMANPEHAPYGRAAEQALRTARVYEQLKDRLVLGENIRQTTDYVEQGNADAGIVAYALVIAGSPASFTLIDAAMHRPIEQAGAVVRGTGAELTARCALQYLLDPPGQAALERFGFEAVKR